MLLDVTMPRLSDQMEEATVTRWLKGPGDSVARGEPLVEIETDKATMVYEAEFDGVLEEIVVADGGTAALGAVIARARGVGRGAPSSAPAVPAAAPARRLRHRPLRPRAATEASPAAAARLPWRGGSPVSSASSSPG